MNRPKPKPNNPRYTLTNIDIEQIVLMAWGDTIPFETIELEYGLTETEVRKVMRANQTEKTYIRWRKRVEKRSGTSSKHAALSTKTSTRQKY
jgi:uncharacterized protein (TIGR03643 family)